MNTLDDFTSKDKDAAEAELDTGGHMGFPDICSVPIAPLALSEFCGVKGMLVPTKAFPGSKSLLTQAWLKGPYPWWSFDSVGL